MLCKARAISSATRAMVSSASTARERRQVLIIFLLVMAYGSAKPALVIFLNVPVAATGGVPARAARGSPSAMTADSKSASPGSATP